jgi:hypothetical protein
MLSVMFVPRLFALADLFLLLRLSGFFFSAAAATATGVSFVWKLSTRGEQSSRGADC